MTESFIGDPVRIRDAVDAARRLTVNPDGSVNVVGVVGSGGVAAVNDRDTQNEQSVPLLAGETFEGEYTRVEHYGSVLLLYAATTPLVSVQLIWSDDGINPLGGAFGVTTVPVAQISGYNVAVSLQNGNYLAPYYKLKVVNGVSDQGVTPFFISVAWLLRDLYNGSYAALTSSLSNLSLALLTRSVLAGTRPDGTFANVGLTIQGDMRVGYESQPDANNTTAPVVIPAFTGVPYAPNVGGAPAAPAADMWVGEWTQVKDFAGVSVAAAASVPGRGYAEFSNDAGVTISHYYTTLFFGSGDFQVPKPATHYRLAFQNLTASTCTFRVNSLLNYTAVQPFLFPIAGVIDPSFPALLVKASITGQQPDGDFANQRVSGTDPGNTTVTPLGAGAAFTGIPLDSTGFAAVLITIIADQPSATDGIEVQFSNDGFATISTAITFTYGAMDVNVGRRYSFPAPIGEEYRIVYTNGAAAQTLFDLRCELSTQAIQPMTDDIGRGTVLVSPGLRISQVLKRSHQEVVGVGVITSGSLFTVPAGKVLHVHTIEVSLENSSGVGAARVRIRDGSATGTLKFTATTDEATTGLGGVNPTRDIVATYPEPLRFDSGVFLQVVTWTVVADLVAVGYLENVA